MTESFTGVGTIEQLKSGTLASDSSSAAGMLRCTEQAAGMLTPGHA